MQVKMKTVLNRTHPIPGFRYASVRLVAGPGAVEVWGEIEAHAQRRGRGSLCAQPAPTYDRLARREWTHVGAGGLTTRLFYTPRRVSCPAHGVRVEAMPWNEGKRPWTRAMRVFLARWARRLSWRETAAAFGVSWEAVYRSVQWLVAWGLAHRVLAGITALGLDERPWRQGKRAENCLTLIYQVEAGCRRLLWVGLRRTERTVRRGLQTLGAEVVAGSRVVVSDMWRPYLAVVRKQMGQAVQILDRFHLTALLNTAVDQVRRGEGHTLRGQRRGERLQQTRWLLLKPRARVRGKARARLDAVIHSKLKTARAWSLKEAFAHFWTYHHPRWAEAFLDAWITRALRSRLVPMRKVAQTLRDHEPLILNWFGWKKAFASAAVEGLNNKARVVTRRAYGFRQFPVLEVALYHTLGNLPEPELPHRFC
jgi:transposase